MRIRLESNKWLLLGCMGLIFGLATACSDDDSNNGGDAGVSGAADAAGGRDAAADSGAGDAGADGSARDDVFAQGCDINGVTLPGGLAISEYTPFDNWGIYQVFDGQYIELSLVRDASIDGVGTFDFAAPATSNDAYLLLATDCDNAEQCQTYYNAVSGTLEVAEFEKTVQGDFRAELKNIRLVELGADGHALPDGKTWCVSSAEVTASSQPLPEFVAPQCTDSGVRSGFEGGDTEVTRSSTGWVTLIETTQPNFPRDELRLELRAQAEVDTTYAIDDVNLATCTTCLSIRSGCDGGDTCQARYNAGAGELIIDTLDMETGAFEARLTNARMVEVTQDGDYTLIVEDGGGWCVDSYRFSGTFTPSTSE